jgi:hypothetical protein
MFVTSQMAWIGILLEICAGCVIGLVTLALVYRARLRLRLAITGALVSSVVFLVFCGVGGWADSQTEFVNGRRVDFSTSVGEDLRIRNYLAENALLLAIASSSLSALLFGIASKRRPAQNLKLDSPH